MSNYKEKILNIIFLGKNQDVIDFCKNIEDKERKLIFKEIKPYLDKIKLICRFDFNTYSQVEENVFGNIIKSFKPQSIQIKEVLRLFIESDDIEETIKIKKININSNKDAHKIMTRNQMFHVLLAEKKGVLSGLKVNRNDSIILYNDIKQNSFIYNVGKAVLERNDENSFDLICEYFDKIEKYDTVSSYFGFFDLVKEVEKRFPEKKDFIKPFLAKSLYYEGLRRYNTNIKRFTPEEIMITLDYQITDERNLNLYPPLISLPYFTDEIIKLVKENYFPREELIDLTIKNLMTQNRKSTVTGWVKIYDEINITEKEILERKDVYINLLNSISPQGIQISQESLKKVLNELSDDYEYIIQSLGFNLGNNVQKVAKSSFIILKTLYKKKDLKNQVIENIVQNISIPNKNIRQEVLKWIINQELTINQKDTIREIFQEGADPIDREILKDLLVINSNNKEKNKSLIENTNVNNVLSEEVNIKYKNNVEKLKILLDKKDIKFNEINKEIGDLNNYNKASKFTLFNSEIELAEFLSLSGSNAKRITYIGLEKILASIIKFKDIQEIEKVKKILDQCFKLTNKIEKYSQDPSTPIQINVVSNNIIASLLAYFWVNKKHLNVDENILKSWFQYGDYLTYKRFDTLKELIDIENIDFILSTPDYNNFFIEPEILANRIVKIPFHIISFDDLFLSLFRLSNSSKDKAWEIIKNYLDKNEKDSILKKLKLMIKTYDEVIDKFKKQALILTFAPINEAKKALSEFINYLDKSPSTDTIYSRDMYPVSIDNNDYGKSNIVFRLLNASIRGRYNLSNPFDEMPELSKVNLDNLVINLGINRNKYHQALQEMYQKTNNVFASKAVDMNNFKSVNSIKDLDNKEKDFIKNLIFYPFKITKENTIKIDNNDLYSYSKDIIFYYPNLSHYYSATDYPSYNYMEAIIENKISYFPAIAQNLFDMTCSQKENIKKGFRYYIDLLPLGESSIVDISNGIDVLFSTFSQKNMNDKEKIHLVIYEALKDGRISFLDVINNLVTLFDESKGFKYVMESVKYLCSYSEAFEKLTLLAIEEYIGKENTNTKNISVLSDLLIELMSKYNRTIKNSSTLKLLEDSFNSKKKNAFKDKAKVIFDLQKTESTIFEKSIIISLIEECS
ncbi:MAG: DUF6493 family protein [Candidatus Sericytochromatia bacterium]